MHTSLSIHFIDVQCLDMFRALLVHPQEALHGSRTGVQLTSTTAHNRHQVCVRVVPPEDEQVMPEICRDTEHQ
jgi:hypothetical protein